MDQPETTIVLAAAGVVVLAFATLAVGRYCRTDTNMLRGWKQLQYLMYAFLFFVVVNDLSPAGVGANCQFLTLIFDFLAHSNH